MYEIGKTRGQHSLKNQRLHDCIHLQGDTTGRLNTELDPFFHLLTLSHLSRDLHCVRSDDEEEEVSERASIYNIFTVRGGARGVN